MGKESGKRKTSGPPTSDQVARKPVVFLASAGERRGIMRDVGALIERAGGQAKQWSAAFPAGEFWLESLLEASRNVDGALIVAAADDLLTSRGKATPALRDNVLLEFGIFLSALGRKRATVLRVVDEGGKTPELPTDLDGLSTLSYAADAPATNEQGIVTWMRQFFTQEETLQTGLPTPRGGTYSWEDVVRGVQHIQLGMEADGYLPDCVLGLGRSGGIVGGLLASHLASCPLRLLDVHYEQPGRSLEVELQEAELDFPPKTRRVLVVEGATTGGATPRAAERFLGERYPQIEFKFGFLIQSAHSSFRGDYRAYVEPGTIRSLPYHGPRSRTFLTPGVPGVGYSSMRQTR